MQPIGSIPSSRYCPTMLYHILRRNLPQGKQTYLVTMQLLSSQYLPAIIPSYLVLTSLHSYPSPNDLGWLHCILFLLASVDGSLIWWIT